MDLNPDIAFVEKSALAALVVFLFLKTRGLTTECLTVIKDSTRSNEAIIRLLEAMSGQRVARNERHEDG